MAADYTVTKLAEDVRRIAGLPAGATGALWLDDVIAAADAETQEFIVPLLVATAEEYLVTTETVSVVSGTAEYPIPSRAVGNKLRDLQVQDQGVWVSLPRVEPENANRYSATGAAQGYMFRGSKVVLVPTPSSAATMRMVYYRRPSRLVSLASVGVAGSFSANTTTGQFTLGSVTTVPSYTSGGTGPYDVVCGFPPFDVPAAGQIPTYANSAYTFTGSLTLPVSLSFQPVQSPIYMCFPDETPVPQIPSDLIPLLAHRVAVRMLESLGDPRVEQVEARAARVEKKCVSLISPRGEGVPRVVINYSGPGWSRRRRSFTR